MAEEKIRRARRARRRARSRNQPEPPPRTQTVSERLAVLRDTLHSRVLRLMDEDTAPGLPSLVTALLKVETDLAAAQAKEAREGATLDDSPAEVAGWLVRHLEDLERIARLPRGSL